MKASFDGVAWGYNVFMRLMGLFKDEDVIDALCPSGNEQIVDLGGGTGHYAAALSPHCREVVVVDASQRMLSCVPRFANIRTLHADMAATGLPDSHFDIAMLIDVLHHAPYPDKLLNEAHRILKARGSLLILDFNADYARTRLLDRFERMLFGGVHYRTPAQTAELLAKHGFKHVERKCEGWCFVVVGTKT